MTFDRKIWENLYNLAFEYAKRKPWEYYWDNDLFEVDLPDGQKGYCSILGHAGELIGMNMYVGDKGIDSILRILNSSIIGRDGVSACLSQECISFFFGDRDEVGDQQYEIIRALGLKFRGRGKWMYFETYRKHYYPVCPTDAEASLLISGMEGLIMVLDHSKREKTYPDHRQVRVRRYDESKEAVISLPDLSEGYPMDEIGQVPLHREFALKKAAKKKSGQLLELGVFYLRDGILDEEGKPYHGRICLLAQYNVMVYKHEVLIPADSAGQKMIDMLGDWIEENGLPKEVYVPDIVMLERIKPLTTFLKLKASVHPLPAINNCMMGLGEFMDPDESTEEETREFMGELLSSIGLNIDEVESRAKGMSQEEFYAYMTGLLEEHGLSDDFFDDDDEDWDEDWWEDDDFIEWEEPKTMEQKLAAVREFFEAEEYETDEKYCQYDRAEKTRKDLLLCNNKKGLQLLAREAGLEGKHSFTKEKLVDSILEKLDQIRKKKALPEEGLPVKGTKAYELAKYIQKKMNAFEKSAAEVLPEEALEDISFSAEDVLCAVRWGLLDVDLGYDDDDMILYLALIRESF